MLPHLLDSAIFTRVLHFKGLDDMIFIPNTRIKIGLVEPPLTTAGRIKTLFWK